MDEGSGKFCLTDFTDLRRFYSKYSAKSVKSAREFYTNFLKLIWILAFSFTKFFGTEGDENFTFGRFLTTE